MSTNLKQQTISGMIWGAVGKFGTLGISFISNMVLARLLLPGDYGCIGMLAIFIAVSQVFINGGLGVTLIQKSRPTHLDYTTVFYWNLLFSFLFIVVLFFIAPYIADFYRIPLLKDLLRVQSLILIINSFSLVQIVQLQKDIRFKDLSIRNIISSSIATIVAIIMAYSGFGVWSLVFSTLINGFVSVILLWQMSSWRPTLVFSFKSLKELFDFGGLMLLSSLIETIYNNIQGLIIGRVFTAKDLGYYSQAKKLEEVTSTSLSSIVNEVSFPVFSKLQNDKELLLKGVRKNVKAITFLNFPLMVLFIVIAYPLFTLLFSERWESSVPYFQILCISSMIYTLNTINTNTIKALGRGKIYFILQFFKRSIGILLIIWGIKWGINGMLWAMAILGYVCFFINAFVNGKLLDYGIIKQIKDVGLCYLVAIGTGVVTYYVSSFFEFYYLLSLLLQIFFYSSMYLLVSFFLRIEGFFTYCDVIKNLFRRNTYA